MEASVVALIIAVVLFARVWELPRKLATMQSELDRRHKIQEEMRAELHRLRDQLAVLRDVGLAAPPSARVAAAATAAAPVVAPLVAAPVIASATVPPVAASVAPVVVALPVVSVAAPAPPMAPLAPAPVEPAVTMPVVEPIAPTVITPAPEVAKPIPSVPAVAAAPVATPNPAPIPAVPSVVAPTAPMPTLPAPVVRPGAAPTPAPVVAGPFSEPSPSSAPAPKPTPALTPQPVATPAPIPTQRPPVVPPTPPPPRRPTPAPVPTGPSWWDKASTVLLENWTGILGAVVLVTGVGFLGIYAALRLAPPYRFLLICGFAAGLLGARFGLRNKAFARQLNAWLLSSAAAIFLFACVGSVSIAGLRWATAPFDYLLLLAGVSANLYLAWRSSREAVSTLHGVLSLVALAVLPPTSLTLAAAAGVTGFGIAITYRQLWKYQLLLSIASFFAFHLYWHQQSGPISNTLRLTAMGLVLLVGAAAAVVQYRSVYAKRRFEPLLFTAHVLNWTTLGISLYLHSTGSIWKTIPLALGALLTFWAGRQAKRLGIGWLFQTDTIISLILALATAFSLQGWHATPPVILLFMLLESLLITLIMARQREALVYRVALAGAGLAGVALLLVAASRAGNLPPVLYRDALVLALAGWAGLAFAQLIYRQPLLAATPDGRNKTHHDLLSGFTGLAGLLQAGAGLLLARVLFGGANPPAPVLILALAALGTGSVGLSFWVRTAKLAPGWVRQQQLLLGQFFAVLAVFGLHETGLSWPVVLGILYAENLLAVLLLARQREKLLYHVALTGAYLTAVGLLAVAGVQAGHGHPPVLYRNALVLALAGWASLFFINWTQLLLGRLTHSKSPNQSVFLKAEQDYLSGLAGLAGVLQVGAALVLARALFAWQGVPVGLLLVALVALAAISVGLAAWLRTPKLAAGWVRQQQLILGQLFAVLAVFGLREMNLSWPEVLLLLYFENLLVAWATARQHENLLLRLSLSGSYLAGAALLLVAGSKISYGVPAVLYRDALWLAMAGWAGIGFAKLISPPSATPTKPEPGQAGAALPSQLNRTWLHGLAGLAGLLQAAAGALLARVLFGWQPVPVWLLLGALLGLAAVALGLAAWLHSAKKMPAWVRQQQLVLAQAFAAAAVLGLHETGLSWPVVLGLLYAENLAVALLTAQRREMLLYHLTLASAFLTGTGLLLAVSSQEGIPTAAVLYRDAVLLALTGWAGIAFAQRTYQHFATNTPTSQPNQFEPSKPIFDWLGGFAALAGLLQAGTGLLLGRALFAWHNAPTSLLLVALMALAGTSVALAAWVQTKAVLPVWVRRQQLVLGQYFAVLAVFGLHEIGLSWPAVFTVLYAENLLVALLLAERDEDSLLHTQTYVLVLQALFLPLLVRSGWSGSLGALPRAGLLAGAALFTVAYQARRLFWRRTAEAKEYAMLQLGGTWQLPLLGLAVGWLLLGAGTLVYELPWAAWATVALLGSLLWLRARVALPGVWAGLALAAVGYLALQWGHVLTPASGQVHRPGDVLLYLLPTLAVPVAGLRTSWWAAGGRFVRWPWVYLLGSHGVVALVAAVPAGHVAYFSLGLLAMAATALAAAQIWRRALPDAAVHRAGQPDRYLLHLGYWLLSGGLLTHLWLLTRDEQFFGQPAEYFTAAVLFAVLAGWAAARPPATAPLYHSWRRLHPWLAEAALLFGTATLGHNVRTFWLPLLWASSALGLGAAAAHLPKRFRRLSVYGRLYYWLAAGTAGAVSLLHLDPSQLLSAGWWEITAAVALLFGYVWQALTQSKKTFAGLSPAWHTLARPPRRALEAWLLYPAFVALALLLIQSFDRSVLTVLLMLEVVAVFSTSLLLRRQDLRYLSLAGLLACLVRLVFFDLSRSGTITRAIVFILMGLLLLGMNALYARFKARFTPIETEPDDEFSLPDLTADEEPQAAPE